MVASFLNVLTSWVRSRETVAQSRSIENTRALWSRADQYYSNAESDAWTGVFWRRDGHFRPLFDRIDSARMIELACGQGRHSWQMRDWPNHKTLVDFVDSNIAICRERFQGYANVDFVVNNGRDLSALADSSATGLFCYDAMVHFHHDIVRQYLLEIARVLRAEGLALLHHSNYSENVDRDFKQNPHWRAHMSKELFSRYARAAELEIVEQRIIDWDSSPELDAISLLKKAR